ncbi:winged helix-turn-helix domain-containing protein, partial [Rhizobium esperanzae]|uniref:winged helix-turn-helix domain-containing protein n=1 Tax=Rhizobium esperanzae TaxID=1967781 RepID=UPI001FEEAF1C
RRWHDRNHVRIPQRRRGHTKGQTGDFFNSLLVLRKEVVVDRRELIERVYEGDAEVDSNSIEVIVARLRRKIGAELIETVRGRGYMLTAAS